MGSLLVSRPILGIAAILPTVLFTGWAAVAGRMLHPDWYPADR